MQFICSSKPVVLELISLTLFAVECASGSVEERAAVRLANNFSSRRDEEIYEKPTSHDVKFGARVDENAKIGEDFKIMLDLQNTTRDERHVLVTITAKAAFYTGIDAKDLKELVEEVTLEKEESKCPNISASRSLGGCAPVWNLSLFAPCVPPVKVLYSITKQERWLSCTYQQMHVANKLIHSSQGQTL